MPAVRSERAAAIIETLGKAVRTDSIDPPSPGVAESSRTSPGATACAGAFLAFPARLEFSRQATRTPASPRAVFPPPAKTIGKIEQLFAGFWKACLLCQLPDLLSDLTQVLVAMKPRCELGRARP